jgi:nitrite reductase/ring-hydroxylating ferredoxin subunit/uncharacterized membrane protein
MPWLDELADVAQPLIQRTLEDAGADVRDLLDGTWLGAPLHPALTDVPIGSATAAVALDAADAAASSPGLRAAADGTLALAVASQVAAAATGLNDARYLRGDQRRLATLHGLVNAASLVLNVASLAARAGGRRGAGRSLSLLSYGLSGVAAHFGGQLSFGLGVRANHAPPAGPSRFTPVMPERDLDDDALRAVRVAGVDVLVARARSGRVCAIASTCTHMGGPLADGMRDGDSVVCPWHGSRFDLCTGDVIHGPAVYTQPRFEARVHEGVVEVRLAPHGD